MDEDLRAFPGFAAGVSLGVLKAALTEPDVFLLFTSGLLVTRRSCTLRGLGVGLGGLYLSRRADQYVSLLAHLIGEGEPERGNE